MEEETLKFVPLKSVIDAGFWESLTKKKLDEWKLDDSEKPITWSYTPGKSFIRLGKQFTVFFRGEGKVHSLFLRLHFASVSEQKFYFFGNLMRWILNMAVINSCEKKQE